MAAPVTIKPLPPTDTHGPASDAAALHTGGRFGDNDLNVVRRNPDWQGGGFAVPYIPEAGEHRFRALPDRLYALALVASVEPTLNRLPSWDDVAQMWFPAYEAAGRVTPRVEHDKAMAAHRLLMGWPVEATCLHNHHMHWRVDWPGREHLRYACMEPGCGRQLRWNDPVHTAGLPLSQPAMPALFWLRLCWLVQTRCALEGDHEGMTDERLEAAVGEAYEFARSHGTTHAGGAKGITEDKVRRVVKAVRMMQASWDYPMPLADLFPNRDKGGFSAVPWSRMGEWGYAGMSWDSKRAVPRLLTTRPLRPLPHLFGPDGAPLVECEWEGA